MTSTWGDEKAHIDLHLFFNWVGKKKRQLPRNALDFYLKLGKLSGVSCWDDEAAKSCLDLSYNMGVVKSQFFIHLTNWLFRVPGFSYIVFFWSPPELVIIMEIAIEMDRNLVIQSDLFGMVK